MVQAAEVGYLFPPLPSKGEGWGEGETVLMRSRASQA